MQKLGCALKEGQEHRMGDPGDKAIVSLLEEVQRLMNIEACCQMTGSIATARRVFDFRITLRGGRLSAGGGVSGLESPLIGLRHLLSERGACLKMMPLSPLFGLWGEVCVAAERQLDDLSNIQSCMVAAENALRHLFYMWEVLILQIRDAQIEWESVDYEKSVEYFVAVSRRALASWTSVADLSGTLFRVFEKESR
ncbi:hypothetical protein ACTSKR_09100 [Chitinibacteraceae bacterium HSL-7]